MTIFVRAAAVRPSPAAAAEPNTPAFKEDLKMRRAVFLLVGVFAFALAACGGDDGGDAAPATTPGQASAVPFDQAFIDAMIPHHRSAIEMAKAAKERGLTQPDLQKIADDIIESQQREIDQMLAWREEWFGSRELGPVLPEVLGVTESELGMGHGGGGEIENAEDVDMAFAMMMIPHHEGAVAMAEAARERADHEEIRELAKNIIEAQEAEIATMQPHAGGHHG